MENNLRILVITVSSWNSKIGSNTWTSLLSKYDSSNVANLCIRDEIPDSKVCSRYFVISENKVIKSILKRNIKSGRELLMSEQPNEFGNDLEEHNKRYRKMRAKRRYTMLLARELVWNLGKWKTKELDVFLDSFKPDIILYSMEGYIHLNKIVEYAIKRTGAKAIGYIWDDNFTYKQSKKLGYRIYRYFQRKSLKRIAKKTNAFFAISDMTKNEADEFFGVNCQILTKPLNRIPSVEYKNIDKPIRVLYTGNLLIGRDRSLLKIVEAIKELPKNSFIIDIYTQTELKDEIRQAFEESGFCFVHTPIAQEEVLKKQKEADILLFLEDIDGPDAKVARLSFSTKITDYLSSGRAILAVGCKETAPMQYFIKNNAAIIVTDKDEMIEKLKMICDNTDILIEYAECAARLGIENHSPIKIQKAFDETIEAVLNNN